MRLSVATVLPAVFLLAACGDADEAAGDAEGATPGVLRNVAEASEAVSEQPAREEAAEAEARPALLKPELSDVFAYVDPMDCMVDPSLTMAWMTIKMDPQANPVDNLPEIARDAATGFERETEGDVSWAAITFDATWHGLDLEAITWNTVNGEWGQPIFEFDEPFQRVEEVLAEEGFAVGPGAPTFGRERPEQGYRAMFYLSSQPMDEEKSFYECQYVPMQ